jgi:hypothetical protein
MVISVMAEKPSYRVIMRKVAGNEQIFVSMSAVPRRLFGREPADADLLQAIDPTINPFRFAKGSYNIYISISPLSV